MRQYWHVLMTITCAIIVGAMPLGRGPAYGELLHASALTPIHAAPHGSIGFARPFCITLDGQGDLYVTDSGHARVVKLSPTGRLLAAWRLGSVDANGNSLTGIAVDRQGNVYVADKQTQRIIKLSPNGQILTRWSLAVTIGVAAGKWTGLDTAMPIWLAVDGQGNVYASYFDASQVLKFTSGGKPLARWGVIDASGNLGTGAAPGQFDHPTGLTVDRQGNVYVVDHRNGRIQKLSPSGKVLAVWGMLGSDPGQFTTPEGMAVDSKGDMYVDDVGNDRLQILSPAGKPLAQWPLGPSSPYQDVAVDQQGNVYLTEHDNVPGYILKLSPTGHVLAEWR